MTKRSYTELETLYRRYKDQGLAILAFPCNQFGHQEPGSAAQIEQFVRGGHYPNEPLGSKKDEKFSHAGATFDVFDKVDVNGPATHPVFAAVKAETGVPQIKGNFNKFIVDRNGKTRKHFLKKQAPLDMEEFIKQLLAEPVPTA